MPKVILDFGNARTVRLIIALGLLILALTSPRLLAQETQSQSRQLCADGSCLLRQRNNASIVNDHDFFNFGVTALQVFVHRESEYHVDRPGPG